MLTARLFKMPTDLLSYAVKLAEDGLFLEFGVATGTSINHIAKEAGSRTVYGFDLFKGLPEHWRHGYGTGQFSQQIPVVQNNVELIVGLFADTLPQFLETHGQPAALIHIDCDLYSSTKTIFDRLTNRIIPGTVIIFDEFWNYPGWKHHEYQAFMEFVSERGTDFRYDALVSGSQQVCVVIE